MYLAIDPGDKHHGYAEFEADGSFRLKGVAEGRKQLAMILKFSDAKIVIIEDWELYPNMAQKMIWSQFGACRTIGYLERWAEETQRQTVFQKPMIKSSGYPMANLQNKHKHDEDAYVHGIYYLIAHKLINPATLKPMNKGIT